MKKLVFLSSLLVFEASVAASSVRNDVKAFDGFYVGVGANVTHAESKARVAWNNFSIASPEIMHRNFNIFGFSAAVGYGYVFGNNIYAGAELLCDVSKDKKFSGSYNWQGNINYSGKVKGFVPSAVIKLGYHFPSLGTVFYGRVGAAFARADFHNEYIEILAAAAPNIIAVGSHSKVSCVVPVIGIGVEKNICAFGVKLEGDYHFNANRESVERCAGVRRALPSIGVSKRLSRYTVRLMTTYNFK